MKRLSKKQSITLGATITVLALTAVGIWQYRQGPSVYASAISSDIRHNANFTLYVPRQLPGGYTLKADDGVRFAGGILFMQFSKDDQTIFISQQKAAQNSPGLKTIQGFTPLEVSIGEAVIGSQEGIAAAIIKTQDSIITLSGDGSVPQADLGLVAKRLEQVR